MSRPLPCFLRKRNEKGPLRQMGSPEGRGRLPRGALWGGPGAPVRECRPSHPRRGLLGWGGERYRAARTSSNSCWISCEGGAVTSEATTMHRQETRKAGSSS